jgi:hypothetical protein
VDHQIIYNLLNSSNTIIHHSPNHTYFPSNISMHPSTIDFTITNSTFEMTQPQTHTLPSDHNVVDFTVKLEI